MGNDVLMVSGSDAHGTPITVRADEEGVSPREIFERYHQTFLETYQQIGLTFDLFTHTDTENHHRVSQDIFPAASGERLPVQGGAAAALQPAGGALPARPLRGGRVPSLRLSRRPRRPVRQLRQAAGADRADQPAQQGQRRHRPGDCARPSTTSSTWPSSARSWATICDDKDHWRPNVINFARNYVKDLHGRPITRDIDWGIPMPLPGYEGKCLYVWFEAVIGYFSASVEWAKNQGTPDAWQEWWYDPEARIYNFIGKDNIPFHTVIWPAELLAVGRLYCEDCEAQLNLPYDVPANEYLNFRGGKFSKSRGACRGRALLPEQVRPRRRCAST